eukprot:759364-Hanusia_phi.AAC.4
MSCGGDRGGLKRSGRRKNEVKRRLSVGLSAARLSGRASPSPPVPSSRAAGPKFRLQHNWAGVKSITSYHRTVPSQICTTAVPSPYDWASSVSLRPCSEYYSNLGYAALTVRYGHRGRAVGTGPGDAGHGAAPGDNRCGH